MKAAYCLGYLQFNKLLSDKGVTDENVETKNSAFIQIHGECDDIPFHFQLPHPNVLSLYFDDVDEPCSSPIIGSDEIYVATPMSEEQAKEILSFIKRNIDKDTLLVHCHAGISRSGAVARWVSEYIGLTYEQYKSNNPHTAPNQRIVSMLRASYSLTR